MQLIRTDEIYLKDKNVWNIREYDTNKLVCTTWTSQHVYLVDRNDTSTLKKPVVIEELRSRNNHVTDLWLVPGYSYDKCPFILKRAMKSLTLIDVKNLDQYLLYDDENTEWGYNKVALVDRGNERFDLLFVCEDHKDAGSVLIKHYAYPAYFT